MPERENRLTLTREIARSGIATVWEGYDSGLDRKVLVKSIHPQYAQESDLRTRFEREARAIARLSHPNVVQIFDLRMAGEELSLILEFIEGTSLGKLLKERGALPLEIALTITCEILSGLDHAHAAGIVHRDLKPDNVLVSKRGEVKLTDFGLAMLRDLPSVTQEGMVIGTPSYMAPEQAEGASVTPATDLFAAGVMLFEMLTGQKLNEGSTVAATFQNVLRYQPPRLEDWGDSLPPELLPVLRRMLERTPQKRYESAAENLTSLLTVRPGLPLPHALIADFLSGDVIRRPVAKSVARTRAWTHPFRIVPIVIFLLAGAGLVYYLTRVFSPPQIVQVPVVTPPSEHKDSVSSTIGSQPVDTTLTVVDTALVAPPSKAPTIPTRKPDTTLHQKQPAENPPAVAKPGFLTIASRPWAQIFIKGNLAASTPMSKPLELAPGSYELVLLNPEIGQPIVQTVILEDGKTTALDLNLYDYVARIRIASVKPWADLYINGEFECRSPSSKTIFRPLGIHKISLKNPDFPEFLETVTFHKGDPVYEIRVDLSQPRP
jgi:serine/threonine protein kinase